MCYDSSMGSPEALARLEQLTTDFNAAASALWDSYSLTQAMNDSTQLVRRRLQSGEADAIPSGATEYEYPPTTFRYVGPAGGSRDLIEEARTLAAECGITLDTVVANSRSYRISFRYGHVVDGRFVIVAVSCSITLELLHYFVPTPEVEVVITDFGELVDPPMEEDDTPLFHEIKRTISRARQICADRQRSPFQPTTG